MPAGFEVINDSGSYQVDQNYSNLIMRAKGTATTSGYDGRCSRASVVVNNGVCPLIAVQGSGYVGLDRVTRSGSQYTFILYTAGGNGTSINYFVFDDYAHSSDRFGIEIFNAAEETVFHSSDKQLRVADVITSNYYGMNNGYSVTLAAGRQYAVCFSAFCGITIFDRIPFSGMTFQETQSVNALGSRVASNVVTFGNILIYSSVQYVQSPALFPINITHVYEGSGILILDVTDF